MSNNVNSFPPEWNDFDVNKFVNVDGGSGALVVHMTGDGVLNDETGVITVENGVLDHTAKEIYDVGNAIIIYDYKNDELSSEYEFRYTANVVYGMRDVFEDSDGTIHESYMLAATASMVDPITGTPTNIATFSITDNGEGTSGGALLTLLGK